MKKISNQSQNLWILWKGSFNPRQRLVEPLWGDGWASYYYHVSIQKNFIFTK